jgi:CelD/BcsL family acetyltransferase involved in cellulose biosynthesis
MLVPNWSLMDCSLSIPDSAIGAEWRELARRSLAPSGPNSPELLLPAFGRQPSVKLATVRDSSGLQLALPLERRGFPLRFHASIATPVSFYGLPHVGRHLAVAAVTAMLRSLNHPVLFHSVPVGGPLWEAISKTGGHFRVVESWHRAVLKPGDNYSRWFEQNFERKRRKEYRRLQSRLSEQGRYEAASFGSDDDVSEWVDAFLKLEGAGWKGRRGTAMNADPAAVAALKAGIGDLAQAGKLRFWKLALDDRPLAMLFAIVEGNEAWLGKIAYDESFARFSPGVLLVLHATEQLFAEGLAQVDSCAIPDHPMIDHLWRDRLEVADVMIAASAVGGMRFRLTVAAERSRRGLRAAARNLFYKLTGRHRS